MPRWYYKPAIIGFELQERGSTGEPKVFMEENLTGSKHHVIIRRQQERPLDRPDVAEFTNQALSDPHAIIEFTRDGRLNVIDKSSERGTFRVREGRNKFHPDVVPASIPLALEEGDVIQLGSFLPDDPISPMWLEIKPIYDRTPLAEFKNGQSSEKKKLRGSQQEGTSRLVASKSFEVAKTASIRHQSSDEQLVKPRARRGRKRKRVIDSDDSEIVVTKRMTPPKPMDNTQDSVESKSTEPETKPIDIIIPSILVSEDRPSISDQEETLLGNEMDLIDLTVEEDMDTSSSRDKTPPSSREFSPTYPPNNVAKELSLSSNALNSGGTPIPNGDNRTVENTIRTSHSDPEEDLQNCELWLPPSDSFMTSTVEIPGLSQQGDLMNLDWTNLIKDPYEKDKDGNAEKEDINETSKEVEPKQQTTNQVLCSLEESSDTNVVTFPNGTIETVPIVQSQEGLDSNVEKQLGDVSHEASILSTPEISYDIEGVPGLSPSPSSQEHAEQLMTPPISTQTLPKGMASLLHVSESPEQKTLNAAASEPSHEHIHADRTTSTINVPLPRDETSKNPLISTATLAAVEDADLIAPRDSERSKCSLVFENPRTLPRENSAHTDITSDMGDLRIHTNCDANRSLPHRIQSSPESSPGFDLLSPYLEHANKLPRLRKYFAHR